MEAKVDESVSVSHTDFMEEAKLHHSGHRAVGTVQLIDRNEIVLIPTPSPDPRGKVIAKFLKIKIKSTANTLYPDPLNLPQWRKWAITIILSLCMNLNNPPY